MRRIAVGLLIWTCSFLSLGLAQEMDFFVETYTTKDGLASNMVYAVAEDQQGYVWFGTANGLSRFDGAVFQLMYQPDSTKAVGSCLNHPTVKALLIDQAGNIWVGTQGGGLNRIDHQSQRVSYYLHDPTDSSSIMHNQILSLLEGPDGNIWVGTEKGLSIFHPEEERFYNHYADKADESKLFSSAVLDLSLDQAGDIWFGTWGGTVHRVVRKEQTPLDALWFQRFPHRNMAINSSSDKAIWGIHADQHGRLWGGTFGQGLVVRNLQSEDSRWHRFAPSQRTDMVKEVFSILEDQAGRIWVAAGEGLAIIEMPNADSLSLQQQLRAATIHRFQQLPGLTHGFASNQLRDLYEASNGLIWIAFEGGVAKYDPDLSRFTSVLNAQAQTEPITVQAICRGPNQWLWLGTQDHGLIRIHKEQGKQSRLVHQAGNSRSLLPGEIHTVKQIGGEIWAGTDHGLSVVDPSRFSIRNYPLNHPESDPPASVYDLEIGPDSLIYLASHEGLIQLDPQTMAFRFFQYDPQTPNGLPENHLNDVAIEADGTIWLGTASHGLVEARLNELGELICTTHLADPEDPLSLFNKDFLSVLPTKDHIWIGSVQGLQWMDRATLEFDRAGMEAGLPTPNVTGLQIDESGFVWCGTNPGIARFNPETRHFTLFGSRNGIKSSKHFRCGSFQDESGFLYFGGNDGLSYFDPTEVEREYLPPAIQFNGVRIGDQPVRVMEEDPYLGEPILRQPLNQLEEIQLSYRHRVLRIDFSVINFRFADLSSLAYRLTGVEEHWNYGHTQRSATYTNLSPGTYVFQVRTANHEGKWSPQPRELTIVVHPPFWDTWWFQTGVGLAALILGFLIYWYRVRTIKVQNQILQQKVQERTLELRQASEQAIMAQQEAEDA
ncbi:MAG: two-component regulator propeller domain-containing protein, partial [Bacteroidota bacterium]